MKSLSITACLVFGFAIIGCSADALEANALLGTSDTAEEVERNCWTYREQPAGNIVSQNVDQNEKLGFVPPVAGTIVSIDSEASLVTLNVGSARGIAVDDRLTARKIDFHQGSLLVVKSVNIDNATAKVSSVDIRDLKTGDMVFKDTTILISHSLVTNHELDPMALAKRHAESDLQLGIQRILYYGKGASFGTKRVDSGSGLPMQMNGGCIVSPELQSFTQEYNRLMRAAAKQVAS